MAGKGLEPPRRVDALPEYREYEDTGCEFSASCLGCPLPECRYVDQNIIARMRRGPVIEEVRRMASEGKRPQEIATAVGISKRTVFRYLQEVNAMKT